MGFRKNTSGISWFICKLILILIKIYSKLISPFLSITCRFYPTCSEYAYEAFNLHGVIAGLYLTILRLMKCNPFSKAGIDLVATVFPSSKKR